MGTVCVQPMQEASHFQGLFKTAGIGHLYLNHVAKFSVFFFDFALRFLDFHASHLLLENQTFCFQIKGLVKTIFNSERYLLIALHLFFHLILNVCFFYFLALYPTAAYLSAFAYEMCFVLKTGAPNFVPRLRCSFEFLFSFFGAKC